MIAANTYRDACIAVFGLGRSGIAAALSLQAGGAKVLAWDDRKAARVSAMKRGVELADLTEADWEGVEALVLSPGIPHLHPEPHWSAVAARGAGVPIISDIEIFARELAAQANPPKLVAVTGTNGKSTTTSLIGHIVRACGRDAQVGGNIGRGVLSLDPFAAGAIYVVELSSYQLERAPSLRADAAVLLNVTPDHLDRHGGFASYEAAKRNVFANQTSDDTAIVGVDSEAGRRITMEMKTSGAGKSGPALVPVSGRKSLGYGVSAMGGRLFCSLGRSVKEIADLNKARGLPGDHNRQNAAAAYAACAAIGLDPVRIGKAILSFRGLSHRMETVGRMAHVTFVNDSKATNAAATSQALSTYDNIHWIAGGRPKAGGVKNIDPKHIAKAYLIGEAASEFAKTLKGKCPVKRSGELEKAVLSATRDALASGQPATVLLSPACSSFDQFADFETRGQVFRDSVNLIIEMFEGERERMAG